MPGKLKALRKVAALDSRILELEAKQNRIPELLSRGETELEETRQELTTKEADLKTLRAKTELKEKEFQMAEQAVIKLRNQINQAKTNKEFQALQHEILSKEADNARLEDAVLKEMQKVDRQKEERDALARGLKKAEAEFTERKAELEKEQKALQAEVDVLARQRAIEGKDVPADIFAKYERLISRRGQTAMVAVVGGTCQGCFMKMRPETMAQLRKADDLVFCHSCSRILYLED